MSLKLCADKENRRKSSTGIIFVYISCIYLVFPFFLLSNKKYVDKAPPYSVIKLNCDTLLRDWYQCRVLYYLKLTDLIYIFLHRVIIHFSFTHTWNAYKEGKYINDNTLGKQVSIERSCWGWIFFIFFSLASNHPRRSLWYEIGLTCWQSWLKYCLKILVLMPITTFITLSG